MTTATPCPPITMQNTNGSVRMNIPSGSFYFTMQCVQFFLVFTARFAVDFLSFQAKNRLTLRPTSKRNVMKLIWLCGICLFCGLGVFACRRERRSLVESSPMRPQDKDPSKEIAMDGERVENRRDIDSLYGLYAKFLEDARICLSPFIKSMKGKKDFTDINRTLTRSEFSLCLNSLSDDPQKLAELTDLLKEGFAPRTYLFDESKN